jgi:4-fold beta flower protein
VRNLYTKNGKPLQVSGDAVYDKAGRHLGQISGDKVYSTAGKYLGTIDGDRVVYRSTDSAHRSSASARMARIAGTASASMARSAIWGKEPTFD